MGKGDHRRPLKIERQAFADNWERIFGEWQYEPSQNVSQEGDDTSGSEGRAETVPKAARVDRPTVQGGSEGAGPESAESR